MEPVREDKDQEPVVVKAAAAWAGVKALVPVRPDIVSVRPAVRKFPISLVCHVIR